MSEADYEAEAAAADAAADAAAAAEPNFVYDPTVPLTSEQILSMLDSFSMSPEDKDQIRRELLYKDKFGELPPPTAPFTTQMAVLFAFLLFIALIFAFFGYKLYRSLVDKERKREEKKKLKQQKKRK